jgi:hypothetical protein
VSIVPPAFYAQLAAERGQLLAQGKSLMGDEAAEAAAAAAADGDEAAAGVAPEFDVRVNVRLGGSMYFV